MADFKTPIRTKRPSKSDTQFTIPASPFLKRLGYGTGVSVYELDRSPRSGLMRSPWAIKRIIKGNNRRKNSNMYGKRIIEEANILKKMNHPNIVGFRMFTTMDDGRRCLGMEACEKSLGDMIEERMENGLACYSPDNILKVALDIGKALDYIHTKIMILHGDIKSYNILINGDFGICKLCDFGVSLKLDENGLVKKSNYIGTELWSAPEVINGKSLISTKADLFSFGLTLWEMLALKPPHSDTPCKETNDDSVILVDVEEDSMNMIGTRPPVPDDIDETLYRDVFALFYCMTEILPQQRPSAHHIILCTEDMIDKRKQGIPYTVFL